MKDRRNLTKEFCFEIASQFETRSQLSEKDFPVYHKLRINGWLDEVLPLTDKWHSWTFEECRELALLCDTRNQFKQTYLNAYKSAHHNGWFDEITKHMYVVGNTKRRCVYVYILPDNSVYIGLTYNIKNRHNKHKIKGILSKIYKQYGFLNEPKIISNGYIDIYDAMELEKNTITEYKENGYNVLNTLKGGQVGITTILNFSIEELKEDALSYNSRWEWQQKSSQKYDFAKRYKLLDIVCSHMEPLRKKRTLQDCIDEISHITEYSVFTQTKVYQYVCRKNWLPEVKKLLFNK